MPNQDDILTTFEAAKLLKVSEKTLRCEVSTIPHFKIGKQFRFVRGELLRWARCGPASDDMIKADCSSASTLKQP